MKLRNKKTGNVIYVDFQIPLSNNDKVLGAYSVTSLKELNESFEDYTLKEPLIRAKEIREEIKLFAYRNEINSFIYQARNGVLYNEALNGAVISLEVSNKREVEHLIDGCLYTLGQLCGEEE